VSDWRRDILSFWFRLEPSQWWKSDPVLDEEIRERFLQTYELKRQLPVNSFLEDSLTAVAAVILFDQVPRNMFRGSAEQYATDHLALAIARSAVNRRLDQQLQPVEQNMLYMPFEHSENLADQNRAVLLQSATGDPAFTSAAEKHREVIRRFGRFPHRNALLGRAPRAAEAAAGDVFPW
jgi:uncharacterized protein (DUF924 family)